MNHNILISLSLFLSQFYVFSSGIPQPGHIVLALSIGLFFITKNIKNKNEYSNILLILIFYISLVNLIWSLLSSSTSYIISLAYWIFNLILFLYITNNNINFNYIQKTILTSLIFMILIWALGLGRYDFYPRYNGLFNDPNQMGFWVLCSLSIYLLKPNKYQILVLCLGLFLIILTMSRSAIVGILFIFIGYLLNSKFTINAILLKTLSFMALIISLSYIFIVSADEIQFIADRLVETKMGEQAEIRGYTALLKYPEYLFFGGGQGEYFRFSSTNHEIHSTWAGLLFYYGIVGTSLFLFLLYKIFSQLYLHEKLIFLGPLIYGFSTYGARTIIFWYLISLYINHIKSHKQIH
ncbi:MAG: hypothetical protein WC982_04265 [Advenella sp.]